MVSSSIWSIEGTLIGTTTLGQRRSGSNGNEGVLHIPQNSKTGASQWEDLMLHPGHSLEGEGVLSLCRNAVDIISNPSRQVGSVNDCKKLKVKLKIK